MNAVLLKIWILFAAVVLTACSRLSAAADDRCRGCKSASVRRVFHNGEHNAFTDLVRFQGKLYLTFRSCPDGHMVHPTASIIILPSDDGAEMAAGASISASKLRDTRDPHFLVFRDKLFVYTGTWYSGATTLAREDYDLNKHLGYAAWSEDGATWHSPIMLEGTFGHYIWRAAAFGGKAYLCGRRKLGFAVGPRGEGRQVESLMLESDDGLIWRKRAVFQEIAGDETAFLFEPDGSVLGIGRRSGPAQLLRSRPPYTQWDRKDLDRSIGGPLLTKWGDRYVVGGRKIHAGRRPEDLALLAGGRPVARVRRTSQRRRQLLPRLCRTGARPSPGLLLLQPRTRRGGQADHGHLSGGIGHRRLIRWHGPNPPQPSDHQPCRQGDGQEKITPFHAYVLLLGNIEVKTCQ